MRNVCLILIAAGLTGCAAGPAALPPVTTVAMNSAASALVFDAPIILDQAPINLSRANHGQAAFFGFEDTSTSYYDVVTDNRESSDGTDQFTRESVSEHIGSTRR